MSKLNAKYRQLKKLLILPTVAWVIVFFLTPIFLVFTFSLFERGPYGNIEYHYTFRNYLRVFDGLYYSIIARTAFIAFLNAIFCLVIGYPIAYYIATRNSNKLKNFFLILVLLPFWTNFLIRTFSWMIILGDEGLINNGLIKLHIINSPIEMLFTPVAVQIGLLYNYLPFMILPLYSSIEKIDPGLYMASRDLGANARSVFKNITFPLSRPGILTGLFLVFIPSFGEFVIPDLLGGAKATMVGNVIKDQFLAARNWPFGSALVLILMAVILLALIVRSRVFNSSKT